MDCKRIKTIFRIGGRIKMNKKLEEIKYDQDSSKEKLMEIFEEIDNLMPKLNFQERHKAVNMLDEIGYFIDLKERDEDLDRRGIY